MPVTNGYIFTDFTEDITDKLDYESNPEKCVVCNSTTGCDIKTFPCVYRVRNVDTNIYVSNNIQTSYGVNASFPLCAKCTNMAAAIMDTSDHIAVGSDWWDMVDHLSYMLKETNWTDWRKSKQIQKAVKKICFLENAINKAPQPQHQPQHQPQPQPQPQPQKTTITDIPQDILTLIFPHLVQHEIENSIIKIQNAWKKYKTSLDNIRTTWSKCDDCGQKKPICDLHWMDACADGSCCQKLICIDECRYLCPHCDAINIIGQDEKSHEGEELEIDCLWCGKYFDLYEEWWGPSEAVWIQRYD